MFASKASLCYIERQTPRGLSTVARPSLPPEVELTCIIYVLSAITCRHRLTRGPATQPLLHGSNTLCQPADGRGRIRDELCLCVCARKVDENRTVDSEYEPDDKKVRQ